MFGYAHLLAQAGLAGGAPLAEQPHRGQDLPGRAVAALQRVVGDERALDRVELAAGREPLDGHHPPAVLRRGEREARVDPPVVDQHGAGAARPAIARALGAGQPELVAQHVEQRRARRRGDPTRLPVDRHRDLGVIEKPSSH
jgi:hypothetical protein